MVPVHCVCFFVRAVYVVIHVIFCHRLDNCCSYTVKSFKICIRCLKSSNISPDQTVPFADQSEHESPGICPLNWRTQASECVVYSGQWAAAQTSRCLMVSSHTQTHQPKPNRCNRFKICTPLRHALVGEHCIICIWMYSPEVVHLKYLKKIGVQTQLESRPFHITSLEGITEFLM